jgi:hypothetical protein
MASSILGGVASSVVGGLLGGSKDGGGSSQTASREPWAEAKPYLVGLLNDAQKMRNNGMQQPFNPVEQGAMSAAWDNAKGGLFQLAPSMFEAGNKLASGQSNYNPMNNFDANGNFNFGGIGTASPDLSLKSPFVWQQNQHWKNDSNPDNWVPLGVDKFKPYSAALTPGDTTDPASTTTDISKMSDAQLQELMRRIWLAQQNPQLGANGVPIADNGGE